MVIEWKITVLWHGIILQIQGNGSWSSDEHHGRSPRILAFSISMSS